MSNGTTTTEPPRSPTIPVNPTPTPQSDPAFVPSPLQPPVPAKDPWEEDAFKAEVAAAGFPGSPQADSAWMAALYKFKSGGATTQPGTTTPGATTTPAAAPTVTALNPSSTPANADVTVNITGTGFDAGAKVMVGPTEASPTGTPTATDLSVLIPAAGISMPGAVEISVKNGDGQTSNAMSLTLT
jgi:IPT/TIG domain